MPSLDDQLYDVHAKLKSAMFDNNIEAIDLLEAQMDRLLDAKHQQMAGH